MRELQPCFRKAADFWARRPADTGAPLACGPFLSLAQPGYDAAMERSPAERRLLRNSLITILLGSAIVWLPVVNMLANQPASPPNTAESAPPVPWQLLLTCVLADIGITLLILLNLRVNLRRLRRAADGGA